MRTLVVFVAGLLVGLAVHIGAAQSSAPIPPNQPIVRLNHVAVAVPNLEESLAFYHQKLGFREVIRQRNPAGQPTSAYIQVSRDTFIEMQQANAERPAGITHFGLAVDDVKATVATFRQRGAMANDPAAGPSAFTGAINAGVLDNNGMRIELSELPPASVQRKAAESWK